MSEDLVLVRSDQGDGGWSLHAPGATDEEIACGDAVPLASGPSHPDPVTGEWLRPNASDYASAQGQLAIRLRRVAASTLPGERTVLQPWEHGEDRELAQELLALLELQRDLGTPHEAQVASVVGWFRARDVLRRGRPQ